MSEGELYQNFREQATFCKKCVLPCNKVQGVVSCSNIKLLLDEAKAEVSKGSVIGESKWFKKWFGEAYFISEKTKQTIT